MYMGVDSEYFEGIRSKRPRPDIVRMHCTRRVGVYSKFYGTRDDDVYTSAQPVFTVLNLTVLQ